MLAGLRRGVTWEKDCILAAGCGATKCQYCTGAWVGFEWDENKRDLNLRKHGLDFVRAADLFEGPLAVEESKKIRVEERWVATGFRGGVAVSLVFTRRGDVIRIILSEGHEDMKERDIRRYTATEPRAMIARGEDRTGWDSVRAKTEAGLEADIASDPDWKDVPVDWIDSAVMVMPITKKLLSLRLDNEIVEWFRAQGPGYQTKINAVLRAYVEHEKRSK